SSSDDPSSSSPSPIPQHPLLPTVQAALEKCDRVSVWRLPAEISQSRLGGRTSPSNACTLIALQLIELFERRNLHFLSPTQSRVPLLPLTRSSARALAGAESRPAPTACTRYIVGTFVEAMVEGNEAHELAVKARSTKEHNFTIPDAIAALQQRHTEIDFCSVAGSLAVHLPRFVRIALRSPSLLPLLRLHFVIIAFERTVLLVADRRTNSFILLDSHLHGSINMPTTVSSGAVVASAHFSELAVLAEWMAEQIFPEMYAHGCVQEFEISTVAYSDGARDCPGEHLGGGFAASRLPPPTMRPMPVFA
ncbi:hypothetical protein PMAYCL1PPCAC_15692, partial [Pristionchus mayeri]